jgi:hypothetical protein
LGLAVVATYVAMALDTEDSPGIFAFGVFVFIAGVATALLFR